MISNKDLGKKIREKRKQRGLNLSQLAKKIGYTSSFLSQVERGIADPSITSLRKIAEAFEVPIFYFMLDKIEYNPVVKRGDRKSLRFPGSNLTFELLSPDLKRNIEMISARLEPGAVTCEEPLTHHGEECTLVIQGSMEIQIGEEVYNLEEGDTIYYFASIPHKITSTGEEDLIFVSAITPPDF
ncbi:XRE family transcriptional regulator [Orenia metallireducens]|jgi:transcriptional regulator with XRE-family HTH domain|uniref:Transcriptional regulator, XRE family with cupin sensor n=1 Tax=Orenia metallireducens TaxID=1413210 RepID=A0A285GHH2_9FIRM|nr:XRE family transcriptional regulator [Orenia metallireducens]PRX30453.1 XRE family transcriptional regulator [Orenia metallireducens]SNY22644.1 transcriptional regulator, XRE family with cupin sensor [Orenia metallireducens]